jgi:hypothetical protein
MPGHIEGERPHVERAAHQPKQPDQMQPLQGRAAGEQSLQGPTTVDRSEPSQPLQESQECQQLPNVWDVLEREVRLWAPDVEDRPRYGTEEYMREFEEMDRLEEELIENGTPREKLIIELYSGTKFRPVKPPRIGLVSLSLEQFHQLRSWVEPKSTEEIAEEVRKLNEESSREWEEYHERHKDDPPTMAYH